ncbi:unnamed protein product, partial [Sphagnum balticum]
QVGEGIVVNVTFGISREDYCVHPKYPIGVVEGFKITSTKEPNILEIQFYDQHFDITVDVLRSSWAGCFILLRHGYLPQLLQTLTGKVPTRSMQNDSGFRLRNTSEGYVIGGSCCGHKTLTSDAQLEECWEGGILLAEYYREWRPFLEHWKRRFIRLLWQGLGRHVRRRHLNARKRRGIMYKPSDAVC